MNFCSIRKCIHSKNLFLYISVILSHVQRGIGEVLLETDYSVIVACFQILELVTTRLIYLSVEWRESLQHKVLIDEETRHALLRLTRLDCPHHFVITKARPLWPRRIHAVSRIWACHHVAGRRLYCVGRDRSLPDHPLYHTHDDCHTHRSVRIKWYRFCDWYGIPYSFK